MNNRKRIIRILKRSVLLIEMWIVLFFFEIVRHVWNLIFRLFPRDIAAWFTISFYNGINNYLDGCEKEHEKLNKNHYPDHE